MERLFLNGIYMQGHRIAIHGELQPSAAIDAHPTFTPGVRSQRAEMLTHPALDRLTGKSTA